MRASFNNRPHERQGLPILIYLGPSINGLGPIHCSVPLISKAHLCGPILVCLSTRLLHSSCSVPRLLRQTSIFSQVEQLLLRSQTLLESPEVSAFSYLIDLLEARGLSQSWRQSTSTPSKIGSPDVLIPFLPTISSHLETRCLKNLLLQQILLQRASQMSSRSRRNQRNHPMNRGITAKC